MFSRKRRFQSNEIHITQNPRTLAAEKRAAKKAKREAEVKAFSRQIAGNFRRRANKAALNEEH